MIEDIANITTIIANLIVFVSAGIAVIKWAKQKKKKPLHRQRRRKHKR